MIKAFHGTPEQFEGPIRNSPYGELGSGVYWASTRDTASAYSDGGWIVEATLDLKNPLRIDEDPDLVARYDFDHPGLALIRLVYGDQFEAVIEARRHDPDGLRFGEELSRWIEEAGYDGVILTFEDGARTIMTLSNTAIQEMVWHPDPEPELDFAP